MGDSRRALCTTAAILAALALALPAAAGATTRAAAARAALAALAQTRAQAGSGAVFGLPAALPASAVVREAGGPGATMTARRRLGRRTWLFWRDPTCGGEFAHPSTLVLVDDRSGRVSATRSLLWMPLVNGAVPAFLASPEAYASPAYRVASSSACPAGARRAAAPARAAFAPAITSGQLAHDCMVVIADRNGRIGGGEFNNSIRAMESFARSIKLRTKDAPSNATGLSQTVGKLVNDPKRPCSDVFIYLAGHGVPAPGARIQLGSGFQQLSPSQGGDPGVIVGWGRGGDSGGPSDTITPQDLADLMHAYGSKATFKIKIVSCFSGRFVDPLRNTPNLAILETSSAADQASMGRMPVAVKRDAGGAFYPPDGYDEKTGEPLWKPEHITNNPHLKRNGPDEFTNGNLAGLTQWASSSQAVAQTGGSLAAGLHMAATSGLPQNFAAQSGYAAPQELWNPNAHVANPGTKVATLTDVPCDAAGGFIDINVPSYADNPTATMTSPLSGCPGANVDLNSVNVTFVEGPAPGSTAEQSVDETGRRKNHLHIQFGLTGSGRPGTLGSLTFTASWQ